ncbi:expressed unknown protein [Seminavis robusta]|uniref:Uncharacterized protein n=1 Tax=Seminavis robusta TaxID=568900 RepID=A0A9N8HRX5_9STRA|nr:expressed unknown protein [Seminavis robusta]|eukprot:Sro1450_g273760.1 n/a (81) ;mRNA; f:6288-6530
MKPSTPTTSTTSNSYLQMNRRHSMQTMGQSSSSSQGEERSRFAANQARRMRVVEIIDAALSIIDDDLFDDDFDVQGDMQQ